MLASTLLALTALAGSSLAAPTARQNGVQIVNRCYNQGQVALTFDGALPSPYAPHAPCML